MNALTEYFAQHQDQLLYAIAGICLVLELALLGISGPLLFIALGCVLTGVLVSAGIIYSWEIELLLVALLSGLGAAVLWKPLKRWQNNGGGPDESSDMIGKELRATFTITQQKGRVAYSGIEWQARLEASYEEPIAVGDRALVVGVDGSLLIVTPH